jgi:hypothetical protein
MSNTANTPERLFIHAIQNSNTVQNNLPTAANKGWSPKLNASKYLLRGVFGCLCFALVYDDERKKHCGRGLPCVFLRWDDINIVC